MGGFSQYKPKMIMQILPSRCTSPKYAYMARLIDKPQAFVR